MWEYENPRNRTVMKNIMANVTFDLDEFDWDDAYTAWGVACYNGRKYAVYISYWATDSISWREDVANEIYDDLYGIRDEYGAVITYRFPDELKHSISGAS